MKVYVFLNSNNDIKKIFSTREKANQYMDFLTARCEAFKKETGFTNDFYLDDYIIKSYDVVDEEVIYR